MAATRGLVAIARRCGVRRLVFTSTTALYGAARGSGCSWIDEDSAPCPLTVYHRTKLAAEALLRVSADDGFSVRILRMSRCFPEPADLMAAYRLHRGIDARDVAEAHAAALGHEGEPCETFIVSGQVPFERADCAALAVDALEVLRVRAPALVQAFAQLGWKLPATIDRVYSPRLAERRLGWKSRYGFDEVLAQVDRGDGEVLPAAR